jgi:steroid delta-isomerase
LNPLRSRPRPTDEEDAVPSPEQVRAAVDAYVDAYNREDRDAFLAAFAGDGVIVDPVGTPAHEGVEARGGFWDSVHGLAERLELVPKDVIVCADEAVMVFSIHATSGGSTTVIDAVDVFHVDDDGRILSMRAYWDLSRAHPA